LLLWLFVPRFLVILAAYPQFQELWITIVRGGLEAFSPLIKVGQVNSIDLIVIRRLHHGGFFW
jgi:hypothetical protein